MESKIQAVNKLWTTYKFELKRPLLLKINTLKLSSELNLNQHYYDKVSQKSSILTGRINNLRVGQQNKIESFYYSDLRCK